MANATAAFSHMIQDSQDFGSDNDHMVSRVFFDFVIDGKTYSGLHTNVKQTVGSSFEDGPLEVSPPVGYVGPMNYEAFRDAVEKYYRSNVGSSGSGIKVLGKVVNLRMRNNQFVRQQTVEFEVTPDNKAW